jgi:hypothetical protein
MPSMMWFINFTFQAAIATVLFNVILDGGTTKDAIIFVAVGAYALYWADRCERKPGSHDGNSK